MCKAVRLLIAHLRVRMRPSTREKSDGWLTAWGLCECMLIRSSTEWLLPFALL